MVQVVRLDNGPEFIERAVADWCRCNDVATVFVNPGPPWPTAWIESYDGRRREELLNGWQFGSLLGARVIIEDRRIDHDEHRPRTSSPGHSPTSTMPSSPPVSASALSPCRTPPLYGAWDRAPSADRPTALGLHTDPDVPPIPLHAALQQFADLSHAM